MPFNSLNCSCVFSFEIYLYASQIQRWQFWPWFLIVHKMLFDNELSNSSPFLWFVIFDSLWFPAPISHSRSSSRGSLDEALASQPRSKDSSVSSTTASGARTKPLLDYNVYMASLLPKQAVVSPAAASPAPQSPQSSPGADKKVASYNCTTNSFSFS